MTVFFKYCIPNTNFVPFFNNYHDFFYLKFFKTKFCFAVVCQFLLTAKHLCYVHVLNNFHCKRDENDVTTFHCCFMWGDI